MKKSLSIALLAMLLFTASGAQAQVDALTTKTATKKMGYTILNPGQEITLYKYQHASHSPKDAEKYAPKYYFVTKASDVLQNLTKENLKKAFPNNHAFHDALDANFKEDKDIIVYDNFHKMYKLNSLLAHSGM